MSLHELKTWPQYFAAVKEGRKPFEVRRADRDFRVGDVLMLREWDNDRQQYTGQSVGWIISYVMKGGQFGIDPDYVVMGLCDLQTAARLAVAAHP